MYRPHRTAALLALLAPLALLALCAVPLLGGCSGDAGSAQAEAVATAEPIFEDVAEAAGIRHTHRQPILDSKLSHINAWMSSVGATVAAADYDRDGWVDFFVTSSRKGEPNLLYRNLGDGTFEEVGGTAGLAAANDERGVSTDAVWGDVDNDGWEDLYLVRWGSDSLYRNLGDGTFEEITDRVFRRRDGSPGTQWANGDGAVFLDFDLDGRLDLYVGNYFAEVDLWNLESTRIMHDDFETAQNGGENYFYHQQPDGTFVEMAREMGIEDPGWTLAVGSADLDNDGWPDLFSADDFGPDRLFLNRAAEGGGRTFEDVTETATGFDTKKGMNVDFGDFNNDGWLDIYVTNITTAEYLQEGNALWHNNGLSDDGTLTLTDVGLESGTYDGGWGWAGKFFDYDNDGDLDILAMNGFISAGEGSFWYDLATFTTEGYDVADAATWPPIGDRSFSGYERNRLFRNDGISFVEVAAQTGMTSDRDGRGASVADYDNDGDLDLFFANQHQPANLYRNLTADSEGAPHWLRVALVADPSTGTNASAIGARVTVLTSGENGERRQIRERDGGNGFSSQSDPRLHFGLGDAERVDLVEVRWPDGGLQYLEDVAADRQITIEQDPAVYAGRARIEAIQPEHLERRIDAPRPVDIDPDELDRRLTELEERLDGSPLDHQLAAAYRQFASEHGAWDRAIEYFAERVEADPDNPSLRLELGSAYVDKIPACGGVAAVVCKGSLARRSLDHFDVVIAERPEAWVGWYARGINHLHWPRALLHADDGAADLARAVEIQSALPGGGTEPQHLAAHVALGDALTKDGRYDEARAAWRAGLAVFSDAPELIERLAVEDDGALLDLVEDKRSLEVTIDTALPFADL